MDWSSYKRVCDCPEVFSRWMLEQTIEIADAQGLACRDLKAVLLRTPVQKPADHQGGRETDMIVLDLDAEEVARLLAAVAQAASAGLVTSGTQARGLGGFVAAWSEYARSFGKKSTS